MNAKSDKVRNEDEEPTRDIKPLKNEELVVDSITRPVKQAVEDNIFDYPADRDLIPEIMHGDFPHKHLPDISGGVNVADVFEDEVLAEKLENFREAEKNDLSFLDEPIPEFDPETDQLPPLLLPEHDEMEIEPPPKKAMDEVEGKYGKQSGENKNGTEKNA